MEENIAKIKKEKTKLIILVVSLVVLITSATYAYFVSSVSSPAISDVNLGSEVSGGLTFTAGSALNLTASLANFAEGDGSLSGSTESSANLKASSAIGSATENYYIYFNITENNFVYSQDVNTPELLLTITDPNGNELTSLTNHPELTHKTVIDALTGDEITGFDVTTFKGLITVDDSYEISTTDTTVGVTQNWNVKLTFVNLNVAQTLNEGKVFESELILQAIKLNYADVTLAKMGYSAIELSEIISKQKPDFNNIETENKGLFSVEDDYGISYYFRGAVDNNWVEFAGFYWRIVRINGDGSIRMIYTGVSAPLELERVVMKGSTTGIKNTTYSNNYFQLEYLGYMYYIGQQHGLTTDSKIKIAIDTWYETNILNTPYHDMISDALFCGDRTAYTDATGATEASGIGYEKQYFGGYIRNYTNKNPSLKCPVKSDAYTVADTINGNGALDYPISLLTVDEVVFAGGSYNKHNEKFYLNTENSYFLISPSYRDSSGALITTFHDSSSIVDAYIIYNLFSIRPVVNLNARVLDGGSGQWNDPYVVE